MDDLQARATRLLGLSAMIRDAKLSEEEMAHARKLKRRNEHAERWMPVTMRTSNALYAVFVGVTGGMVMADELSRPVLGALFGTAMFASLLYFVASRMATRTQRAYVGYLEQLAEKHAPKVAEPATDEAMHVMINMLAHRIVDLLSGAGLPCSGPTGGALLLVAAQAMGVPREDFEKAAGAAWSIDRSISEEGCTCGKEHSG